MSAMSGRELASLAIEILCGVTMGAVLMDILKDALNPIIIFIIIIATVIAILDFADYLPAFSIAFFTGYVVEFLTPFAQIFSGFEILALVLSLVGLGAVVAMKMGGGRDRAAL